MPSVIATVTPADRFAISPFYDPSDEGPLRDEIFGQAYLEDYARSLAKASESSLEYPAHSIDERLREDDRLIHAAHATIREASRGQETLSTDAEWLLDNFFVVEDVLREVKRDLPANYYRELPRLTIGPMKGYPRILALAMGLVAHSDSSLNEHQIREFVRAYQAVRPLTIGELWAVPTMLRLVLIENLRRLATQMISVREDREYANRWVSDQIAEARAGGTVRPPDRQTDAALVGVLQALRDHGSAGQGIVVWVENWLAEKGLQPAELLRQEHRRQAANQVSVGNCITSLRLFNALDWNAFVEQTCLVETILRNDSTGTYAKQDFNTRDRCRQAVERLARGAQLPEVEVANRALDVAAAGADVRRKQVAYYLLDRGRRQLEQILGFQPSWTDRRQAFFRDHPQLIYFGLLSVTLAAIIASITLLTGVSTTMWIAVVIAVSLIPASELAIGMVNFLVTKLVPPTVLPKLESKDGIPPDCATMVVMPTMLIRPESATVLLERLELHYLANPDPQLRFALLTDFADAPQETMPHDMEYLQSALDGVAALNRKYADDNPPIFFVFHRKRLWNASENHWMGWERKRGKLQEFNRLLRGATDTSYAWKSSEPDQLPYIRFVITLDADTNLPRESARRLICTLAHPLNQAQLNAERTKVVEGYGILQPRVGFLYQTGTRSRFARALASSAGVDPYQAAVSDVYMDLFGAGSFIGKGMYDVDAFETVCESAFPENRILSHDLIESNFARCALATDIELLDDFPPRYLAYARREHRWIRGDWQLLPWLGFTTPANPCGKPGRRRNVLGLIERWKVFDNLRRSLVGPAVIVMLALGWMVVPNSSPWLWTIFAIAVACWPLVMYLTNCTWGLLSGKVLATLRSAWETLPSTAKQCGLSLGFLLDQARLNLHAIGVTLGRLLFSRKRLLEWETAAATEQRLGNDMPSFLRTMGVSSIIAAGLFYLVTIIRPGALVAAFPLLALWFLSPMLAWWVSQPLPIRAIPMTDDDRRILRRLARKTWGFFETFVGPEDNWLPPDNYQESPKGEIAHRTSPTNKGLLLLSTLGAHDFGYLSLTQTVERIGHTIDTLERLEKFRGHILNWYDTRTLEPLQPPYVSTVDSGNLLACLIALKHGLLEKIDELWPGVQLLDGLGDALGLAEEELAALELTAAEREPVASRFRQIRTRLSAPASDLLGWQDWGTAILEQAQAAEDLVAKLSSRAPDGQLERWTRLVLIQTAGICSEIQSIAPWLPKLTALMQLAIPNELNEVRQDVLCQLNTPFSLSGFLANAVAIKNGLGKLRETAPTLISDLIQAVDSSSAASLSSKLTRLADRADALGRDMDFRFLYNGDRSLFSIGFNKAVGRLDNAHYDLLASECRIASFLAVARGEVPRKHWFQLGRPVTFAAGRQGLLSWGGTMFEYLTPRLLLPTFANTLLDQAERTAVARQIEFGQKNGVPWGVSESGFYVLDAFQTYQYQSFGVPGLGLKRGLQNDVVIAPYAAMMAVVVDPHDVVLNLELMKAVGGEGPYGAYEAIDYTRRRLPQDKKCMVVRQYMAHHQGMSFLAFTNKLLGDLIPKRLRAEPMVRANELLLQERVPVDAPVVIPPEDDESTRKVALTVQVPMSRRLTTADTPSPRTHILSNGQYTIMVSNSGAGFSTCRDLDVTRWRQDRTRDAHGQFIYVRNLASGKYWSIAHHPVGNLADKYEVTFSVDKIDFRRTDGDIETHTEITVSPERNVEVRRVTLTNHGTIPAELDVTSYAEIVLAPHGADLAHPAFQKLFLETEWVPAQRALLCRRRPRSAEQNPIWAVHTISTEGRPVAPPTFETDRGKFLGRRRDPSRPAALDPGVELTGSSGPVLDPIFALRQRVRVEPGASASVAFATAVADTKDEALGLADQYNAFHAVLRVFDLAWAQSRVELRDLNVTVEESHLFQRLAGFVIYPSPHLRAPADVVKANRQAQPGLWKLGISGDVPILLVRVKDGDELGIIRQLVAAHIFWRINGFTVDLVILNEHPSGYMEGVHEQIMNLIKAGDANAVFDRPGGIFVRRADQMSADDRTLLMACARVVLHGDRGPLADQLDLPERVPQPPATMRPEKARTPQPPGDIAMRPDLVLHNGIGGFTQDGHEYVITYDVGTHGTPAPWSNVVANPNCGFVVTEAGSGYTWFGNSQTNRLTPWSNDPISDPVGEAIYVRDEETGEFWSVTALPIPGSGWVRARHGQGYTVFERRKTDIDHELRMTVPVDDPVKIFRLMLVNHSGRPRRLSATFFAEWVLGTTRESTVQHIITQVDESSGALFARNAYNPDYAGTVAFADVGTRPRSVSGDRNEFLGRNGSTAAPAGLRRIGLSNRVGACLDPCAVIMAPFEMAPGERKEIIFVLGQTRDENEARRLATFYRDPIKAEEAFCASVAKWDEFLSAVVVRTPDLSLNHLVNRWLPYQVLVCRYWGRSAFYQSGGAYGYRDQLQDCMALVYGRPDLTREHLLRAAGRQFVEGDAQHWWHPPSGKGVRTRFSDDYLFLPYVTAFYVHTTGDTAVLDDTATYLHAAALAPGQDEVYGEPSVTPERASLYEHCVRALDRASPRGAHGLPLMGTGDWNDGMNQVGHDGKGESVWLAWFLADTYRQFAAIAERRGDATRATTYRSEADQLVLAIEQNAWDGAWYRRAYFDDGTPLGSATNDECQIDSLPQSWAVIAGGSDRERIDRALTIVEERLIRPHDRLVLLFAPPFDHGPLQPGYIKGYVPGIRENGGQYTHAATWLILAFAKLGRGNKAMELVDLLNPVRLTENAERVERYRVEPYVIAADVYGRSPHIGRGGWTWYTGSASWYYRVILESILGFQRCGNQLTIDPCIPKEWKKYEIIHRMGKSKYTITVENPHGIERGVREVFVDGQRLTDHHINLIVDDKEHTIRVVMGS